MTKILQTSSLWRLLFLFMIDMPQRRLPNSNVDVQRFTSPRPELQKTIDPLLIAYHISERLKSRGFPPHSSILIDSFSECPDLESIRLLLQGVVKHLLFKRVKAQCLEVEDFLMRDTEIVVMKKIVKDAGRQNLEIWARKLDRSDATDQILSLFRIRALALFFGY